MTAHRHTSEDPYPVPAAEQESVALETVAVLLFLSGHRRGQMEKLEEETLRVVRSGDADLLFLPPDDAGESQYQATLHRAGATYEAEVASEGRLWINGERVKESRRLNSGDLLEIGEDGPLLRYRLYAAGETPRKSFKEAFADAFDGARANGHTRVGKAAHFLSSITWDLATYTSFVFRLSVLALLLALILMVVLLLVYGVRLQKRVALERMRLKDVAEMVERTGSRAMTRDDLLALQKEVESRLAGAMQRLEALEARTGIVPRVIAGASSSVAFVQGSFGFIEPETGRPLRHVGSPDVPGFFTLEENGTVVELPFTGTAFVVAREGLLLTNRHVAQPWLEDAPAGVGEEYGLKPAIQRLVAFMPGREDPLELELVDVSQEADLALLRTRSSVDGLVALLLNPRAPQPGDEVVVLGYPTGLVGLVARASPEFLDKMTAEGEADFWSIAQRLSEGHYIKPLATRGIVSQVSQEVILYDAETAFGGSGGPVIDLGGGVVAINTAVLPAFGGSNIGVPARYAEKFLARTEK